MPPQVIDLLNSVRVKWIAINMGLERVIMKQGKFVGYFVSDQQSSFYQSDDFNNVLKFAQQKTHFISIKEKSTRTGLKLLMTIDKINHIDHVLKVLAPFIT